MWGVPFILTSGYPYYYLQHYPSIDTSTQDKTMSKFKNQKLNSTINSPIENRAPLDGSDVKRPSILTKKQRIQRKRQQRRQKLSKRRYREDNFQRKPQKKDRNLPSNILKTFFSLLFDPFELQPLMKTFGQLPGTLPQASLVDKLKLRQQLKKKYLSPASVRSLWHKGILSDSQGLLLRLILKHYLLMHFPSTIICNTKLRKGQRMDYLRVCRRVHNVLMHGKQH